MRDGGSLTPLSREDYEAIAAAVMETSRGRWFLAEYARRNRQADTETVLAVLARFEEALQARPAPLPQSAPAPLPPAQPEALAEIARLVAAARASIGASAQGGEAGDFDSVTSDADEATRALVASVGDIARLARALAATGTAPALAQDLDRQGKALAMIADLEALTARRLAAAVTTLQAIEARTGMAVPPAEKAAVQDRPPLPSTAAAAPTRQSVEPPPSVSWRERPAGTREQSGASPPVQRSLEDLVKLSPLERLRALAAKG